jgi:hypothetical protein
MSGDDLPAALDRQVCPFQFRPDPAFDVLIRNPVKMAIIGNGSRLEKPAGLLMHQDKLQLLPGEAAQAFSVEIGRTLFIDALMLMIEVIVVQPSRRKASLTSWIAVSWMFSRTKSLWTNRNKPSILPLV